MFTIPSNILALPLSLLLIFYFQTQFAQLKKILGISDSQEAINYLRVNDQFKTITSLLTSDGRVDETSIDKCRTSG